MNPHELSLFLKSAISRLASLGLTPGPTPQQRAIRNITEAKSAARDLLAVSAVKDLAQALLDNDVAKHAVQDSFVYQDDGNLTQSAKLADIRSKLIESLSVLKNYIDSTLMELPLDAASDPCSALLEIKVTGLSTFENVVEKLNRVKVILDSITNIAELGGLIEKASPLTVVAATTGSVIIELAATTITMFPVMKIVLGIAKQALLLREQLIRQRTEIIRLESLGIGQEMLKQQNAIHSRQSDLMVQHLAREIELKRELDPEYQRRLEKQIRDMANLIADGVRLLGGSKTEPATESRSLSNADYDQIENIAKDPLLLAPPTADAARPTPQ